MSENQSRDAARQYIGAHWSQLVFATIINIVLPGSGASYLGFPSRRKRTAWQEHQSSLAILLLILWGVAAVIDLELSMIVCLLSIWLLVGVGLSVQTWRKALAEPSLVKVQPIESDTWLMLMLILGTACFGIAQSRLGDLTFFTAPNASAGTAAHDLFYGFRYAPEKIRLNRGQLILANVDGEDALVRVLAVPGDIFALGENTIYLNGFSAPQHAAPSTKPSAVWRMRDMLDDLAAPGERSQPASMTGNIVALDAAIPNKSEVLGPASFVVARDWDLLQDGLDDLTVYSIGPRHIISVPWARVWSWGDRPGGRSDLAQPMINFVD